MDCNSESYALFTDVRAMPVFRYIVFLNTLLYISFSVQVKNNNIIMQNTWSPQQAFCSDERRACGVRGLGRTGLAACFISVSVEGHGSRGNLQQGRGGWTGATHGGRGSWWWQPTCVVLHEWLLDAMPWVGSGSTCRRLHKWPMHRLDYAKCHVLPPVSNDPVT